MSYLETIFAEISRLNQGLRLTFGPPDVMQEQLAEFQENYSQLLKIQTEINAYREILQGEIAKIDAIRLAKAAAGIVLLLVSENNDNNNSDFLSEIGSQIASQVGNNLLDEAIHTENSLRELYQVLTTTDQGIVVMLQRIETLIYVAEECSSNFACREYLDSTYSSASLSQLSANLSDLAVRLKFDFVIGKPELVKKQALSIEETIQELQHFKDKLEKFTQWYRENSDLTVTIGFIETLLGFLGSGVANIEYNGNGELVFTIEEKQWAVADIGNYCQSWEESINYLLPLSSALVKFVKQYFNHPSIDKLTTVTLPSRSLDNLQAEIIMQVNSINSKFYLLNSRSINQQLQKIINFQEQIKFIQTNLRIAVQKFDPKAAFPLNCEAIAALLNLLGLFLVGVGCDREGILVFYHTEGTETVTNMIQTCVRIEQSLKQSVITSINLRRLAEQCLKSANLMQELEANKQPIALTYWQQKVKEATKEVKTINLAFEDVKKMRLQVKYLQKIADHLTQIKLKLEKVIRVADQKTGLFLGSLTISVLMAILGSISAIELSDHGQLLIYQPENEKPLEAKAIVEFCSKLQQKIKPQLAKIEQLIQLGEKCLKDVAFRKKLIAQQRKNQLALNLLVAFSLLVVLIPVGWFGGNRGFQEYTRYKANSLVAPTGSAIAATNINDLKIQQQQLKEAIALLESIPSMPWSSYQQARADIDNILLRLQTVEEKIKVEEEALTTLQTAVELATELSNNTNKLDTQISNLRESKTKWRKIIALLDSIPEETFVFQQAQQYLAEYRSKYNAIAKQVNVMDKLEKVP